MAELGASGVEIRIKGDCDLYHAPAFARDILGGIERGWRSVRVDAAELVYLDSTGVGAFIRILQALKSRGGRLSTRGLRGAPRRVLEMSNILALLGDEGPGEVRR
ncbi:MAG: STAS domain-containing protein [Spirochaetaceae bacterium]|nr:STAS domain-containing protein [Spirochaetaceae bacterium]